MVGFVAMTDVEIGARVRRLLEDRSMTSQDLAGRLGLDPSGMSRALSGDRRFKAREIAMIAEVLNVPTSVLLEDEIKDAELSLAARQSMHVPGTVSDAVDRARFYAELAALVESKPAPDFDWVTIPTTGLPWQQGQALAEEVLDRAGLADKDLPLGMHDLASLLESTLDIQVSLEPLGSGLDGLGMCSEQLKLVMVSTKTVAARQRWTLAHEIGHVLLGDTQDLFVDENIWERTPIETRANAFAAAFLMPAELLSAAWGNAVAPNEALVAELLERFGVSLDALAFRLHNVGKVNAAGRDRIRGMRPSPSLIRNQASRQSDGNWLPTTLTHDAIQAFGEGRVGARWLAELLGFDQDEFLARLTTDQAEAEALDAVDEDYEVAL